MADLAAGPVDTRADRIRTAWWVYRRLVGARIRSDWQYRASFLVFLLGQSLAAGLDLAAIVVIFGQVDQLSGWSGVEVALLFGVTATSFGLADLLVSQVETAAEYVRSGRFDSLLLRPVSPLLQLCANEFELRRLGRLLQPAVVTVVALGLVDIAWSPADAVLLAVTIVSGTVIFGSVWVITNAIAFWTVDAREVANSFTYGGVTLGQYPIDVFASWLRRLVVFVLPIAFCGYFPVARLLDKQPADGLTGSLAWAAPLVAVVAFGAARAVWRAAIREYRSTGS